MALSLFVLATSALSGLATGGGLYASRQQSKLEKAQYEYEGEAARLAAAESAYESTRQFRQAIGSTVALAGARGGSQALTQFTTESFSNYLADQASIMKRGENATFAQKIKILESKSNRRSRDLKLALEFGTNVAQNINLNPSTGKSKTLGGTGGK